MHCRGLHAWRADHRETPRPWHLSPSSRRNSRPSQRSSSSLHNRPPRSESFLSGTKEPLLSSCFPARSRMTLLPSTSSSSMSPLRPTGRLSRSSETFSLQLIWVHTDDDEPCVLRRRQRCLPARCQRSQLRIQTVVTSKTASEEVAVNLTRAHGVCFVMWGSWSVPPLQQMLGPYWRSLI